MCSKQVVPEKVELPETKKFTNNCDICPERFYLNEKTADVRFLFEVDNGEIRVPAHKIFLAVRSSVFYSMFYGDIKERATVKIVDASVKGFKDFLTLFYLNEVEITGQNVDEITNLSNKYDVSRGMEMCEQFLLDYIKTDELCSRLEFAIKFNLVKLQKYCEKKIRINAIDVFKSDDFINTKMSVLKEILQLNNLSCFELDVFNACVNWATQASLLNVNVKENLRRTLGDCFYLIPFVEMSVEDFSQIALVNKELFTIEEVLDIMRYIATGESTERIKKFTETVGKRIPFDWKENSLLTGTRLKNGSSDMIYTDEYTTFSSSHKLLFGGFRTFDIKNVSNSSKVLSGTVNINKHSKSMPSCQLHEKIPFITNVESDKSCEQIIHFDKPMVIKPNMMYTIHVEFSKDGRVNLDSKNCLKEWRCAAIKYETSCTIYTSNGKPIHIEFHKIHSDLANVSQYGSMISEFYFNYNEE